MIGAIDIGGTKIAVAAVAREGRVLCSEACPTEPERGFDDAFRRMADMLGRCIGRSGEPLEGIGVGCTGPVDPLGGRVGEVPFLPGWEGGELAGRLSDAFQVEAALENDADAHALAEYAWGAGRGSRRFVMVTVGTGIGGAMILDGELYRGADGIHPEFGHHVIDPAGPVCPCGVRGCWESLASGPALAAGFLARNPDRPPMTAKAICEAADAGDPAAREAVDAAADYLGLGLANLVNIFAPDRIVLGGGLMRSRHLFWDRARAVLESHVRLVPPGTTHLVHAGLGGDAGLCGAACVWLHRTGANQPATTAARAIRRR